MEVGRNYYVSRFFVPSPTQFSVTYRYYTKTVSSIVAVHHYIFFSNGITSILWTKVLLLLSFSFIFVNIPDFHFPPHYSHRSVAVVAAGNTAADFPLLSSYLPRWSKRRHPYKFLLSCTGYVVLSAPPGTAALALLILPQRHWHSSSSLVFPRASSYKGLLLPSELRQCWSSFGMVAVVLSLTLILLPQRHLCSSSSLVPPRASSSDPLSPNFLRLILLWHGRRCLLRCFIFFLVATPYPSSSSLSLSFSFL